eukprot:9499553-Pyramimonas_sp.AAC.1
MLPGKHTGRGGPQRMPRSAFGAASAADPRPCQPKCLRTDAICDDRNAMDTNETGCDHRTAFVLHYRCTSEYIAATTNDEMCWPTTDRR